MFQCTDPKRMTYADIKNEQSACHQIVPRSNTTSPKSTEREDVKG